MDSAVAKAQALLARASIDHLLEGEDHEGVLEALRTVYQETSLASPSKSIQPLQGLSPSKATALALSLRDLLHGEEEDYAIRFRAWLVALADVTEVTWIAATLPAALFAPAQHVPIKRSIFQVQARVHGAIPLTRQRPTPQGYARLRKVGLTTRDALITRGLQPADLLDIRNFCWETLRPRGLQVMRELGLSNV